MRITLLTLILLASITNHSFSQYRGGFEIGGNIMGAREFVISNENLAPEISWGIRLGYVAGYELSESFFSTGSPSNKPERI